MNSQTENSQRDKGSITGRVTTSQGEPVANATVLITGASPSHKDIAALTNEQGEYNFDDLIPGDYTIMVNAEVYGTRTQQTHLEAGQVTRLDFSLTG